MGAMVVAAALFTSGCGSPGGDEEAKREEPPSSRYAEGDITVSSEFAWSTTAYATTTATDSHLLGFGGTDPERSEVAPTLRITGEIVDLSDGSSTPLTYPVLDDGTFIPLEAEGLGDDFVMLGRLCAAPEELYNDMYEPDTCTPSTLASFLLHEDGTWDEVALPTEVRSLRVDIVRNFGRNGDTVFMMPLSTGAETGTEASEDVLAFSDGAWRIFINGIPSSPTCVTATHFYRLATTGESSTLSRYDLRDGQEEEVPLPEQDPAFTQMDLGCNDAFPILAASTLGGLHTVFALRDEAWTAVEGIAAGADMALDGSDITHSHPRGIVLSMPSRPSFLIDEEALVAELSAGPVEDEEILWAGDAAALVLVKDAVEATPAPQVGDPSGGESPLPETTTVRVLDLGEVVG